MKILSFSIQQLIWFAGLTQVGLVVGSLAIPRVLNWRAELSKVQPLIKQMFWTYAAYILVINLCFGLLSALAFDDLTNGSRLATFLTGFIAAYWISRVLIQFLYFDRTNFPTGKLNKLAEAVLVTLFGFLSIVYSYACYVNLYTVMITAALLLQIFFFGLMNIVVILLGYVFIKYKMVWQSWVLLIVSILIVHLLFLHANPILRMLVIIATTFTAMKVIAVSQSYKTKALTLQFNQWLVFAGGWAGMRAQPFETLGQAALPNAWPMIWFGVSRVIAGGLLILLARQIALLPLGPRPIYLLTTAFLLVGLSLVLHFGLLSISAGTWRLKGVNTYYLFKQPVKSMSLTEFWGKRWNMAFSEMTSIAIFRPLRNKLGSGAALMIAFAFSGLLHELALSVPVNSGYGLPTIYFIIQGVLVLLEKVLTDKQAAFLKHPVTARLWTLFWVIAPMPLLFHLPFIRQIVWPMVGLRV
jgi:hypothetical protein